MAASRSATGTAPKAVRVSETMVGRIMTANTTEAVKIPVPRLGPLKRCPSRGILARKPPTCCWNRGTSTSRPQRPTTMLGTAANRSMAADRGAATRRGKSSESEAAVPMPMGTAMRRATPTVIRVSMMKTPAPNCS